MGPFTGFLGLGIGLIQQDMTPDTVKLARNYACITYADEQMSWV